MKPPIKDTPKEDNLPTEDSRKVPFYTHHTLWKITSERGHKFKGQKAGSRACPLFGGFTVCLLALGRYVASFGING